MTLKYKFRKSDINVSGELNQNLARIAELIEETKTKVKGDEDNTFRVTDILKADVVVKKPDDMVEAYKTL